jgi:hypothetical protein
VIPFFAAIVQRRTSRAHNGRVTGHDRRLAEQSAAFARAFADYVADNPLPTTGWRHFASPAELHRSAEHARAALNPSSSLG